MAGREREKAGAHETRHFLHSPPPPCALSQARAYIQMLRRQRTVLKMFLFACAELTWNHLFRWLRHQLPFGSGATRNVSKFLVFTPSRLGFIFFTTFTLSAATHNISPKTFPESLKIKITKNPAGGEKLSARMRRKLTHGPQILDSFTRRRKFCG